MEVRQRLLSGTDRLIGGTVAAIVAGSVLACGGRIWWFPPALAGGCALLVAGCFLRMLLDGRFRLLRSPLFLLGAMALALACVQLAPLPATTAESVSPASRAAYAQGLLPGPARDVDPEFVLPEGPAIRSPVSLDRSATLRWLAAAGACLAVFWAASHYADRLNHLYIVWGSVLGGFFVNTALALVQLLGRTRGPIGGIVDPGRGAWWGPNLNDLAGAPNGAVLRALGDAKPGRLAWALSLPDRPYHIGTLMGGPGAYLALASFALPLCLGLILQWLAPRGSREPLGLRLGQSGRGGLVVLSSGMLLAGAVVVGLLAGPYFCFPFALGLIIAGLPGAWSTGLRWSAVGLTALSLLALGGGVALGSAWSQYRDWPMPVEPADPLVTRQVWSTALVIGRDFPLLGTGLGTFATVYPYYKSIDATSTTAMSSLLQWWVEAGWAGLGVVALGVLWIVLRVPGAVRRVGTADRALVFGLLGAALGFAVFSAVHWTVELVSVALAASALGGTLNRWLAGATDLFVERA